MSFRYLKSCTESASFALTVQTNQYPKLQTIFEARRIVLDNNLVENAIRPLALGEKTICFVARTRRFKMQP